MSEAAFPGDLLARALTAEGRGEVDDALEALIGGYQRLLAEDSPVRQLPVGWPEADAVCARLGARLAEPVSAPWADRDVFLATQVYAGGGHTAVIGDLVRHSTSADKVVLLTQTVERGIHEGGRPRAEIIARMGIADGKTRICPAETPEGILRWLLAELRELRPRRVFLFHHPQDAPAVAVVQPGTAGAWYLVHHCDRTPCAGLYTEGLALAELSPFTAGFSRHVLGLDPHYLPMTVEDGCGPERPPYLSGAGGRLTTVSSGAEHKFSPLYPEIASAVLKQTGGVHHHIGKLKKKQLEAIAVRMEAEHLPADRFRYTPWVPSLSRAFHDIRADLCIGSFPLGGARTAIESAAAGTPMLAHHPPWSTLFGVTHVLPEGIPVWTTQDELLALLRGVDRAWLEDHGRRARAFYEVNHHPAALARALLALDSGGARCAPIDQSRGQFLDVAAVHPLLAGPWAFLRSSLRLDPGTEARG